MKLPQSLPQLLQILRPLINTLARYRLIIGLLLIIVPVAFVNYRIDHYSNTQSDQARLDEALAKIKTVRFDNTAIEKIRALKDQEATVDPVIDEDRVNPFPSNE